MSQAYISVSPFGLKLYIHEPRVEPIVVIEKSGSGMHCKKPHRRNLYLSLRAYNDNDNDSVEEIIESAVNAIQENEIVKSSYEPLKEIGCIICKWYVNNVDNACKYCKKDEFCRRHEVVARICDILRYEPMENRRIVFYIARDALELNILTNKNFHVVTLYPEQAYVKFKTYEFTYRNHNNARPYLSSYQVLTLAIIRTLMRLYKILMATKNNRCRAHNIYINSTLMVSACRDVD
jgi:hypothetical protein